MSLQTAFVSDLPILIKYPTRQHSDTLCRGLHTDRFQHMTAAPELKSIFDQPNHAKTRLLYTPAVQYMLAHEHFMRTAQNQRDTQGTCAAVHQTRRILMSPPRR